MINLIKRTPLAVIALAITSCASNAPREVSNDLSNGQAELVSRDFVNAISKLRGLGPRETTVQFHMPTTEFGKELHDEMREIGYGIQVLPESEIGANHIQYISESYETSEYSSVAYEVSVGDIRLGREYEIRLGRVFPIAALSVNGSQGSNVNTVDNSIFRENGNSELSLLTAPLNTPAVTVPTSLPKPVYKIPETIVKVDTPRTNTLIPPELPEGTTDSPLSDIGKHIPSAIAVPKPTENVISLGESNYSSLFNHYQPVLNETLTFPDDSLVMGRKNKKTIALFRNNFNPKTDVISVIGCSHGKTNISNGNAVLANGRASRVKEELIMLDVDPKYVYDEGCWAPHTHSIMPSRGVLLTLRRNNEQG